MDRLEKVSRLRSMLTQVSPHDELESLSMPIPSNGGPYESFQPAVRSAAGRTSDFSIDDAASGMRKLKERRDGDINPAELMGLEAIVLRENRPAVLVRAGTYDRIGGVWEALDRAVVRARVDPLLASIGRIELPNASWIPYGGTGFLAGPSLLMTNRHVARLFAEGVGTGRLVYRAGDAAVDFKREAYAEPDPASHFHIERVLMIHPYWDMALLQVAGLSSVYRPVTLSVLSPDELVGRDVVVVGYPARDERNDLALQDAVFKGIYNVKRLQPGKVRPREQVRSFDYTVSAMVHNASTLGGDSGAAVIDVDTGQVVGLHFAGEYLKANYAVPCYELARDARVLASGIQFSGRVSVTEQWQPAWNGVGEAAPGDAPAVVVAQPAPVIGADPALVQVPLNLRISVEVAARPPAAAAGALMEPGTSGQRISMRRLQEMMRDPQIDEAALRPYFSVNPATSKPFAPAVIPNPERVDVALPTDAQEGMMLMSWANDLSRLRRHEKFKLRIAAGDRRPVLVSEGDSWFQFPVLLNDVIDNLEQDYNVWSVDAAGDTLQNMVFDNAEYLAALHQHAGPVRAFLFSGGGNDIIGEDSRGNPVIVQLIRRFDAGRPASWYLATPELEKKLRFIENSYRTILANVAREFPGLPVICHGYDYAIPGGGPNDQRHPAWAANDQWLGKAMRERLGIMEPALQRDIVLQLIDRFNQILQRLCGGNGQGGQFQHAWHVDVRSVVDGRWADELHPSDEGFSAVGGRFAAVLQRALQPEQARDDGQDQERTPNLGDDAEAVLMHERAACGGAGVEALPGWRVGKALLTMREQINRMAPRRSRASDGTIGDAAHRTRDSDHNPWVLDGAVGVVTAMDITHDPAGGCSAERLAAALRESRDKRIKYIIWNHRILSSYAINGSEPWQWRSYSGRNPHEHHVHISLAPEKSMYDSARPWSVSV